MKEDASVRVYGRGQRYLRSRSTVGIVLSLVLVALVCVGAVTFLLRLDPFWFATAVLVVLVALEPALAHRDLSRITSWWLLLLISLPFIANIVGLASGLEPLAMTSAVGWLITSISLFVLCWTIMVMIDEREGMTLREQYLALSAFTFLEAIVIIQGWLSYYSDLGLGTHLVASNFAFMLFFVLCTIAGVVLAFLFRHVGRPRWEA
ncbi:MAG: hypothetical protein ABR879_04505 [Methanomassiliicoccales archaeon]